MDKIDKLIKEAKAVQQFAPDNEYDYEKLSVAELKELITDMITEERILEILTSVKKERW